MENVSRASVNYAFRIEICTDNRYNPIVLRHLKEIHMSLIGEIFTFVPYRFGFGSQQQKASV